MLGRWLSGLSEWSSSGIDVAGEGGGGFVEGGITRGTRACLAKRGDVVHQETSTTRFCAATDFQNFISTKFLTLFQVKLTLLLLLAKLR